jgi:hypothetical protein
VSDSGESNTEDNTEGKMNQRVPHPVVSLNGDAGCEPKYERCSKSPEIAPGHLHIKRIDKWYGAFRAKRSEVILESKDESDDGPDGPN